MKNKVPQHTSIECRGAFRVSSSDERWIKLFGSAEGRAEGGKFLSLEELTSGYDSLMRNLTRTGWIFRECEISLHGLTLFYYHDFSPIPQTVKVQVAPLEDTIHDGLSRQTNAELYVPREGLNYPLRQGRNSWKATYDEYKVNFIRTKLLQSEDIYVSSKPSQRLEVSVRKRTSGKMKLVYINECIL